MPASGVPSKILAPSLVEAFAYAATIPEGSMVPNEMNAFNKTMSHKSTTPTPPKKKQTKATVRVCQSQRWTEDGIVRLLGRNAPYSILTNAGRQQQRNRMIWYCWYSKRMYHPMGSTAPYDSSLPHNTMAHHYRTTYHPMGSTLHQQCLPRRSEDVCLQFHRVQATSIQCRSNPQAAQAARTLQGRGDGARGSGWQQSNAGTSARQHNVESRRANWLGVGRIRDTQFHTQLHSDGERRRERERERERERGREREREGAREGERERGRETERERGLYR